MAINELPNEMLAKIFNYLPLQEQLDNCLVCKHWCAVQRNTFTTQESLILMQSVHKPNFDL